MADKESRDIPYGMIAIILSVIFLISSMDLLEFSIFSREFSSLAAFILVGIGAYLIGKDGK